jgi:hypothetical protein
MRTRSVRFGAPGALDEALGVISAGFEATAARCCARFASPQRES